MHFHLRWFRENFFRLNFRALTCPGILQGPLSPIMDPPRSRPVIEEMASRSSTVEIHMSFHMNYISNRPSGTHFVSRDFDIFF